MDMLNQQQKTKALKWYHWVLHGLAPVLALSVCDSGRPPDGPSKQHGRTWSRL